ARCDFLARLRRRASEVVGDRRSGQMLQREFIDARQVDIEAMDAHLHVGKARLRCETLQVLFGRDLSRRAEAGGGFSRYEWGERSAGRWVKGAAASPSADRQTAAVAKHAAHLPQRERLVGKELQTLLTQNDVEARILQSEIERAALEPFDRCADR